MRHFRALDFRTLVVFAISLIMVACNRPDRSSESDGTASFYVDSLKGVAVAGQVRPKSVWRVPDHVDFSFYACIKERVTRRDLPSQKFSVYNPETKTSIKTTFSPSTKSTESLQTNQRGCFRWQESIKFNYFAGQSHWIMVKREIVGEGSNGGRYPVSIALNPWAADGGRDKEDAIIYMRDGDNGFVPEDVIDQTLSQKALSGDLGDAAQLIVQNVKLKSIPEGEGDDWTSMLVELEMDPQVHTKNARGFDHYESVKDGDFDVYFQVLGSDPVSGIDRRILLLKGESAEIGTVGKAVNGTLKAEFKLTQPTRLVQGNLELVMMVRPRSSIYQGIRPFNGLYRLGPGTQIRNNQGGSLANLCLGDDPRCSYQHYLDQLKSEKYQASLKQLTDGKYVVPNGDYIFSTMKFRFTSVLPGETTTRRVVAYSASTCISRRSTGEPLRDTPMVIRYRPRTDGKPDIEKPYIERTTDESGCLSWTGQIFHKYYEPEEYFEKEITIEKSKNCELAEDRSRCEQEKPFRRDLKFYLNPWDDKFTFGWDAREQDESFFDEIRKRKKVRSRFFLGGFNYHTVRFLYNIDPFMDLEVKKTVLLDIQPAVLRYSGIINARKMTEQLRDGIYLMKVAIQKNYLDPRDNMGLILGSTPQLRPEIQKIGDNPLVAKNFITTNMALVRMVDGHIIYPIELTMHDLRLMRIRSNFLIQLETADERLIQAYHAFRDGVSTYTEIQKKLEDFKAKLNETQNLEQTRAQLQGEIPPALREVVERRTVFAAREDQSAAREELKSKVEETQGIVSELIGKLGSLLNNGGNIGFYLDGSDGKLSKADKEAVNKDSKEYVLLKNSLIVDNFEINPGLLDNLRTALRLNDFSEVTLPKKEEIDLNLFVEPNSGLSPRTFVGPVIFLSNAYGDSMRATDNLDEACNYAKSETNQGRIGSEASEVIGDALDILKMNVFEDIQARQANDRFEGKRLNNAFNYDNFFGNGQNVNYQYNPNFGSLSHLCKIKSVDRLMEMERELNNQYEDRLQAASLKYSFINSFPFKMDYVSLSDEPLLKVKAGCRENVSQCLEKTSEATVAVSDFISRINGGDQVSITIDTVKAKLLDKSDKNIACDILTNRNIDLLKRYGLSDSIVEASRFRVSQLCDEGIAHDVKLHVERTGNYIALGGMNLNFNVGESFSVGNSRSWSGGFDFTDLIGMTGLGKVIKPISVKVGSSRSESDGTSISESTYLVAQIAKFQLDLLAYERCAVVSYSNSDTIKELIQYAKGWMGPEYSEELGGELSKGIMICEGNSKGKNPPKTVKETYFYFTQHFTEGDMLDQADLYNHPWLLALRGMRDFVVFAKQVRKQDDVSFSQYMKHMFGYEDKKTTGWALNHLYDIYRSTMPSYPGFYTQLDESEDIMFPLEQMKNDPRWWSKDPDGEVIHPKVLGEN